VWSLDPGHRLNLVTHGPRPLLGAL
jgi:hypothetical protein